MSASALDKAGGVLCVATSVKLAIAAENISKLGIAYTRGALQHGCKHWLEVAGRAADDLKHIRRGCLLLQ